MISPNPQTVGALFQSPKPFTIPRYQRHFRWKTDEATDLIEDLESIGDEELFLGSIIFEGTKESASLCIVDGQQRITTLLLLLIACRMRAKELNAHIQVGAIQAKIGFSDEATGESIGARLVASESIREMFARMADGTWDGQFSPKINGVSVRSQVNRLEPIYSYFLRKTQAMDAKHLSEFLKTIYAAYVFRIDIESDVQALGIFERTNARGIDLDVADLLKNHLFSQSIPTIEDAWKQITENAQGTLLRMLKYFYISKQGHVRKSELYKGIKKYGSFVGTEKLTQQLQEFSRFYRLVRDGSDAEVLNFWETMNFDSIVQNQDRHKALFSAVIGLRQFGVVQFMPVAFAAIEAHVRLGPSDSTVSKALVRLFTALEKFHFINNAIAGHMGNEVELLYAGFCKEFSVTSNFAQTNDRLLAALREKLATADEFKARFAKVSYQDDTALIAYIFDRINNRGLAPGVGKEIYYPDEKVFRRIFNIEHFLASGRFRDLYPTVKLPDYLDEIGNLLILPATTNGKLGKLPTDEKYRLLTGQLANEVADLNHVREFLADFKDVTATWGSTEISQRADKLGALAYDTVWKF